MKTQNHCGDGSKRNRTLFLVRVIVCFENGLTAFTIVDPTFVFSWPHKSYASKESSHIAADIPLP